MDKGVRNTVLIIVAVIILFTSAFFWKINQPRALTEKEMAANGLILFDSAREVLPFELENHLGEKVTRDDFLGNWTMIFAGFTHCPDICPATMATLSKMYELLDEKPRENLQVMMLSVDPNRDTPETLAQYVPYFNSDFVGLTGDLRIISNLAAQLSIAVDYSYLSSEEESYNVDHSGNIVLINPQGNYLGFFKPPFDPTLLKLTYQSAWIQH